MKKLLFAIIAVGTISSCMAQPPSIPTSISAMRAQTASQFTTAVSFHAITHVVEGNMIDTMWGMMARLNGLISSTGGLQGVLGSGNTATTVGGGVASIGLDDGTSYNFFTPQYYLISHKTTGGSTVTDLTINGGGGGIRPYIAFYDNATISTPFYCRLSPGTHTGNRVILTPDEGNGTGLGATVVIHNTKDPINVQPVGSNYLGTLNSLAIELRNTSSGSPLVSMINTGGVGLVSVNDPVSHSAVTIGAANISGAHGVLLPNEGNGSGTASTLVTHTTKDDVSVGNVAGGNSSNYGFSGVTVYDASFGTGGVGASLLSNSGVALLSLSQSFGGVYTATYGVAGLTGNHHHYAPNEDGTYVTHTTKDPVVVTNGGGIATLDLGSMIIDNGAGDVSTMDPFRFNVTNSSGSQTFNGKLLKDEVQFIFNDVATSTTLQQSLDVNPNAPAGVSTAIANYLPLHGGTLATDINGHYTGTISTGTTINVTFAGAGWVPSSVTFDAKNPATATMLASAHYTSSFSSSGFTLTFLSPQSGSVDFTFTCQ